MDNIKVQKDIVNRYAISKSLKEINVKSYNCSLNQLRIQRYVLKVINTLPHKFYLVKTSI